MQRKSIFLNLDNSDVLNVISKISRFWALKFKNPTRDSAMFWQYNNIFNDKSVAVCLHSQVSGRLDQMILFLCLKTKYSLHALTLKMTNQDDRYEMLYCNLANFFLSFNFSKSNRALTMPWAPVHCWVYTLCTVCLWGK